MSNAADSSFKSAQAHQQFATGFAKGQDVLASASEAISLEEIACVLDALRNDPRLPLALRTSIPEISRSLRELTFYRVSRRKTLTITDGDAGFTDMGAARPDACSCEQDAWVTHQSNSLAAGVQGIETQICVQGELQPLNNLLFHFHFFAEFLPYPEWMNLVDRRVWPAIPALYEIRRGEWVRQRRTNGHQGAGRNLHSVVIPDGDNDSEVVPSSSADLGLSGRRGIHPEDRFWW